MQALGQKYMGIRPQSHKDEMFRDTSIHVDEGHPVPISNFLNAQCKFRIDVVRSFSLIEFRLPRDRNWNSCTDFQSCPRYWVVELVGSVFGVRIYRLLPTQQV